MIAASDGFVFVGGADRDTSVTVRVGFASSGVLCACSQHRNDKNKQKPKELFHGRAFWRRRGQNSDTERVLKQEEKKLTCDPSAIR